MKGLQLAGGWKKFAIPAEIYNHLEITGVHSQMRELSGGVKNPVKSVLGDGLSNCSEKKKGPQVCTARPKSREETPRKGSRTSLSRGVDMAAQNDSFKREKTKCCTNGQIFRPLRR